MIGNWTDYGCAASLCETACMGLGPTKAGVFTALIPTLPMFFSTWETYHSHVLYLGYFNGPTGEIYNSASCAWNVG